jgi:hypothetical protein
LKLFHGTAADNFFFSLYKSFANLYQTLSEAVHNCGLHYEEDTLSIPDLNENTFSKSDALALPRSNNTVRLRRRMKQMYGENTDSRID